MFIYYPASGRQSESEKQLSATLARHTGKGANSIKYAALLTDMSSCQRELAER